MATDIRNLPAFNVDAATFRTWAQGVHAALLACGLVVTADTGQADLATFTPPTSAQAGIFPGFKMYRFDDALQATKPIFLKVEFGTGSSGTKMALAFTVGTATNGAGGFPGLTQSARWTGGGNLVKASGQTLDQYTSGKQDGPGGGRIHCTTIFDPVNGQYSTTIICERLKNGDGTPHESGAVFCGFFSGQASNQVRAQLLIPGQAPTAVEGSWAMIPMASGVNIQVPNVGTDLALSPLMYAYGVWLYGWPLCYRPADLAVLVPFTMDHLGAEHTFMPFGVNITTLAIPNSGSGNAVALIWE